MNKKILAIFLILFNLFTFIPVKAQTTEKQLKDYMKESLKDFKNTFNNLSFINEIGIVDLNKYNSAIDKVSVEIDPSIKGNGEYQNNKIKFKEDPTLKKDPYTQYIVWEEVSHALEDINGDPIGDDSENYRERHIVYMETVLKEYLRTLEMIESDAKDNVAADNLAKKLKNADKKFKDIPKMLKLKDQNVSLSTLESWFGFKVDPQKIYEFYESGKGGPLLQEAVQKYRGTYLQPGFTRFPNDPFNGMQMDYVIEGVKIDKTKDSPGFDTVRKVSGVITGNEIKLKGTTRLGNGLHVRVYAGISAGTPADVRYEKKYDSGYPNFNTDTFTLTYTLPKDVKEVTVYITMDGSYAAGSRGLKLVGTFKK